MATELPLACSLDAGDLNERARQLAEVGRRGLFTSEVSGNRAVLHWDAAVRDDVRAVMAAEAQCCPFLDMRLVDGEGSVELVVEAPAGAESVLADLGGGDGRVQPLRQPEWPPSA